MHSTQSGQLSQGQASYLCIVFLKRDCLANDILTGVNMNWKITHEWQLKLKSS